MTAEAAGDLEARIPPERLLAGAADRYPVDGLIPAMVVRPRSIDEVAAVLRFASEQHLAVVPWGAGTAMDLGNRPVRYDIALDLTRLDAISDYSPEDLVVTVQAGVRLQSLERHLAKHGQFLALDTPRGSDATVGGALSAAIPAPRRLRYGTGRDLVIGLTAVLSGGETVHAGGRVVKNVAGYDLNKLYLGAIGTLGVIVEVSFKLHPSPAERAAVMATFPDCDSAHAASLALVNRPLGLEAVDLAGGVAASDIAADPPGAGAWLVAAFLAGMPAAVERQQREVESLLGAGGAAVQFLPAGRAQRLYERLRDYGRAPESPAALILRCSMLPSEISAAFKLLDSALDLSAAGLTASPGPGSLRLFWADPPSDTTAIVNAARRALASIGAGVTVERCPAEAKQQFDVWGLDGSDVELMRAMKAAYDPTGVLSPGRYLARI